MVRDVADPLSRRPRPGEELPHAVVDAGLLRRVVGRGCHRRTSNDPRRRLLDVGVLYPPRCAETVLIVGHGGRQHP